MATQHQRVTVGTSATQLHASSSQQDVASPGQRISVRNPTGATQAVFIGGPGVTTSSYGRQLAAGESIDVQLDVDGELWAIVAATTQIVDVLRTFV